MAVGGGLVVSVLALYSGDPSSNPAGYFNFLYEKTKMVGPSLKKYSRSERSDLLTLLSPDPF